MSLDKKVSVTLTIDQWREVIFAMRGEWAKQFDAGYLHNAERILSAENSIDDQADPFQREDVAA